MTDAILTLVVGGAVRIAVVSCGFGHSAAVDVHGNLYTWGYGGDGALGLGALVDVHRPTQVKALAAPVMSVSCGGCQSVVLLNNGAMYACGQQRAVGEALAGAVFRQWQHLAKVRLISAGHKSCLAVTEDKPCGVWFFGEQYSPGTGSAAAAENPMQGVFEAVSENRLVQIESSRFGVALDCEGKMHASLVSGQWKEVVSEDVSHVAAGAFMIHFVANRRVMEITVAGTQLRDPVATVGVPRGQVVQVVSGYRTYFALECRELAVRNRDFMSDLRGKCKQCERCPRFAALAVITQINGRDAFHCQRCRCLYSAHELCPEVRPPPPEEVRMPAAAPAFNRSTPSVVSAARPAPVQRSPSYSSLRAEEVDLGLPMDECKAMIRSLQGRCHVSAEAAPQRVYAVSDIHTDFKGNMKWLRELVEWAGDSHRKDAIIVAGDISHDLGIVETTLTLFKQMYGYVFHVCGNHELWVMPQTPTIKHGYHKLLEIIRICDKIGVYSHAVVFGKELAIVPLLTWYEPQFVGAHSRGAMEGFDMACRWTEDDNTILTEMLECNEEALEVVKKSAPAKVVTFSHFLPRSELWFGWSALGTVMGSKRIDKQLRGVRSVAHVFGHSHMNVDRVIDGVHYFQHALGSETHQRTQSSFPHYKPKEIVEVAAGRTK